MPVIFGALRDRQHAQSGATNAHHAHQTTTPTALTHLGIPNNTPTLSISIPPPVVVPAQPTLPIQIPHRGLLFTGPTSPAPHIGCGSQGGGDVFVGSWTPENVGLKELLAHAKDRGVADPADRITADGRWVPISPRPPTPVPGVDVQSPRSTTTPMTPLSPGLYGAVSPLCGGYVGGFVGFSSPRGSSDDPHRVLPTSFQAPVFSFPCDASGARRLHTPQVPVQHTGTMHPRSRSWM